jgi:hypothetical protein
LDWEEIYQTKKKESTEQNLLHILLGEQPVLQVHKHNYTYMSIFFLDKMRSLFFMLWLETVGFVITISVCENKGWRETVSNSISSNHIEFSLPIPTVLFNPTCFAM